MPCRLVDERMVPLAENKTMEDRWTEWVTCFISFNFNANVKKLIGSDFQKEIKIVESRVDY